MAEPQVEKSTQEPTPTPTRTAPVAVLYTPVAPEPFWRRAQVSKQLMWLVAAAALLMLRSVTR